MAATKIFRGLWRRAASIPEDVPNPFNLNQHMKIDGVTGTWIIRRCDPNRGVT